MICGMRQKPVHVTFDHFFLFNLQLHMLTNYSNSIVHVLRNDKAIKLIYMC